jgi:hypothetical protein
MTTTEQLEREYRSAVSQMEAVQRELGTLIKLDPRREPLKGELEALVASVRRSKESLKHETALRNFAGIGSPLHAVLVERFDAALVAELEALAIEMQRARDVAAAARRAAKAAAAPPSPAVPAPPPPAPPPTSLGTMRYAPPGPPPPLSSLPRRAMGTVRGRSPTPEVYVRRAGGTRP